MSYDHWKTTPPKGNGFNCPECLADCSEDGEEIATDEQGVRHYKCWNCDAVFGEDEALSDDEVRTSAKEDAADREYDRRREEEF